jgi:hypothetical protein
MIKTGFRLLQGVVLVTVDKGVKSVKLFDYWTLLVAASY